MKRENSAQPQSLSKNNPEILASEEGTLADSLLPVCLKRLAGALSEVPHSNAGPTVVGPASVERLWIAVHLATESLQLEGPPHESVGGTVLNEILDAIGAELGQAAAGSATARRALFAAWAKLLSQPHQSHHQQQQQPQPSSGSDASAVPSATIVPECPTLDRCVRSVLRAHSFSLTVVTEAVEAATATHSPAACTLALRFVQPSAACFSEAVSHVLVPLVCLAFAPRTESAGPPARTTPKGNEPQQQQQQSGIPPSVEPGIASPESAGVPRRLVTLLESLCSLGDHLPKDFGALNGRALVALAASPRPDLAAPPRLLCGSLIHRARASIGQGSLVGMVRAASVFPECRPWVLPLLARAFHPAGAGGGKPDGPGDHGPNAAVLMDLLWTEACTGPAGGWLLDWLGVEASRDAGVAAAIVTLLAGSFPAVVTRGDPRVAVARSACDTAARSTAAYIRDNAALLWTEISDLLS